VSPKDIHIVNEELVFRERARALARARI
jgi:hypothetical protein